ncbi:MAG: glycogen/starch/alpha-glucan phosphorylase [Candidatus Nanopelagicales bacterium]|jgi:starch phosphorylase|nr:glycogen/starch/alpha-glucan phosphorylase [Candidatus Nanopelagicales bacterium]
MTATADPQVMTPELFASEFRAHLQLDRAVDLERAGRRDLYAALAHTVRDRLMANWLETIRNRGRGDKRTVVYLSAEYLLGRQLGNALLATGLTDVAREALDGMGIDLDEIADLEVEPGLGNGGLGRLAACFADSLATIGRPAIGYGICYEYGIFEQSFEAGRQVEKPDQWLDHDNPWMFSQREHAVSVGFGGHVEVDPTTGRHTWLPAELVMGVPHNLLVPGYRNDLVNTLRLWKARGSSQFNLQVFNAGDYIEAVRQQSMSENISRVLYPEDSTPAGKELRLRQQYFFTACALADLIRVSDAEGFDLHEIPDRVVIQLNDTHPVIAIPELMRILIDERGLDYETAWDITSRTFNYTCHTLLPEALERWSVGLLQYLLPRHMELIYQINTRFLEQVREAFPYDESRVIRMSVIEEGPERMVRMAHLATVASVKVNGVAALHSQLLRDTVLKDFAEMWPDRFTNVTNGVTPRRFMKLANPRLSDLITETVGDGWLIDLERLRGLEEHADDPAFQERWRAIKQANKADLVALLEARTGRVLPTDPMYDVMIKRLHEYKRQMLKLLHVATMYRRLRLDPGLEVPSRVVLFGAKAAPGYQMAKLIIRLINQVGATIDADPAMDGRLAVAFPANYNVTLAERIIPAADLSEQISMAGKEASGTGNMKLSLNGALTVGTLDGANVEIRDLVGEENFFLFGLTEDEVVARKTAGYDPGAHYRDDEELRAVIDEIATGFYSPPGEVDLFRPIVESLLMRDEYLVLADYRSYVEAQERVDRLWGDRAAWTAMSIRNTARTGFFSSDRAMQDYFTRIWG